MRVIRALGLLLGVALLLSGRVEAQPGPRDKAPPPPGPAAAKTPAKASAPPGATKAPDKGRPTKKVRVVRRLQVVETPPKPKVVAPPGSFEALLGTAETIGDLARTIEPFTELCNEQRDMTRRQCEVVRHYLRGVLGRRVFHSDVEKGALVIGPYSLKQGGRTLTLRGCLACDHPVPGDLKHLVTVRPPQKLASAEVKGQDVTTVKVPHPSAHVAEIWQRNVGSKLRAEVVFKLGPGWTQKVPKGKVRKWDEFGAEVRGLGMQLLGYRVYSRCSGDVLASSPARRTVPSPRSRCRRASRSPGSPIRAGRTSCPSATSGTPWTSSGARSTPATCSSRSRARPSWRSRSVASMATSWA